MGNNLKFIIDENRTLSYDQLLDYVNNAGEISNTVGDDADIFEFVEKFIVACANSEDITLTNADEHLEKNDAFNARELNSKPFVGNAKFDNLDQLLSALKKSTSKITLFTSGTTGRPKRVCHTISTLSVNVKISNSHSADIWAFCYNPSHMAGLQVLLQALFNKNICVNLFGKSRSHVYSAIDKFSITNISATPTFYRLLLPPQDIFNNVRRITFGGEKSNESLYEAMRKIFPSAKITNVYASTEVGALLASAGDTFKIPQELVDFVKIQDSELLIHKSILPQSPDMPLDGDFFRTGDIVDFCNPQKTIFKFVSRKSDFVNVGGYKINPNEVEESIKSIQGVADAIVFGKKNSILGNILCADIKPLPNANISESDIRVCLSNKLQQFKIPRIIKFVETLPLTKTGKIKRS